ncbi:hypothetical protein [Yoonia sp. BS5-3]|uniref:Uncharacterized protein n=1 Tax=Yoonia phaeophyticola TaxID=3137369 RepID=A0ABZ2V3W1_9RHOB
MEPDHTISQWFAAMIGRQQPDDAVQVDDAFAISDHVHWDDEAAHVLRDVVQILLRPPQSENDLSLTESLPSPSPAMLTQSAQTETNHLLADMLGNVAAGASTSEAVTPYVQISDGGPGLAIYNAAFIPGWPLPAFAKNPSEGEAQAAQYVRNEAEVVAYLTEQGLNKDLLSKVLKTFKTAADRVGFLLWLSTLISLATATLRTLSKEAQGPAMDPDEADTKADTAARTGRRVFRI